MTNQEYYTQKIKRFYKKYLKQICLFMFLICVGLVASAIFIEPVLAPFVMMLAILPSCIFARGVATWLDEEHKEKKNENIG